MSDQPLEQGIDIPINTGKQFPVLKDLLKSVSVARKFSNLYGTDHPNSIQAIEALSDIILDFINSFPRPTCVFTRDAVIINDHYYESSSESQAIYERLRARGCMAISIVGAVSGDQIREFLAFLNTDPSEIRRQGGPSTYLRSRGVSRIVATEAVYMSGESTEEKPSEAQLDAPQMDRAMGAVIEWLIKQDEDDEPPRLPILQIISDPDMAAKLIREAVTKLHASRRKSTQGEIVTEVVDDLKGLAGEDPENWDKSTPQIRKAISKLPTAMRPACGFFPDRDDVEVESYSGKTVDISEIETVVAEALESGNDTLESLAPSFDYLADLLGVKASGLPTTWKSELEPVSIIRSSGGTYATLMVWETSPTEHGRIVRALAALIPKAMELDDVDTALTFVEGLVEEAQRIGDESWNVSNAKSALQSIEIDTLHALVEGALKSSSYRAKDIVASLVETIPSLSIHLVGYLGTCKAESFNHALKTSLRESGQSAISVLGGVLRSKSSVTAETALEVLVGIGTTSAIREVASAMEGSDIVFSIKALNALPNARIPMVADICIKALLSKSADVRCAALAALGKLGDDNSVNHIIRIATRRGQGSEDAAERIAAIQALGRVGGDEARECLESLSTRRPFIGKAAYEPIRLAAEQALEMSKDSIRKAA